MVMVWLKMSIKAKKERKNSWCLGRHKWYFILYRERCVLSVWTGNNIFSVVSLTYGKSDGDLCQFIVEREVEEEEREHECPLAGGGYQVEYVLQHREHGMIMSWVWHGGCDMVGVAW